MRAPVYDDTCCQLGEGPLWHPERQELFWFDIIGKTLFGKTHSKMSEYAFDGHVSAAGWVDNVSMLIASETALTHFDLSTNQSEIVSPLEADNPLTRSNDGRADPWGGFWIGTMGKNAEADAGAIYRYYRGELRQLFAQITISNAICFSPDRQWGYFGDTAQSKVWRQRLEQKHGWPVGDPEIFIDFTGTGINPDGAVCDSAGHFWNAQWGAARLARYTPQGAFELEIKLPTDHITCPAFGGEDLHTLFATSALEGLSAEQRQQQIHAGKTFTVSTEVPGQKEHQIVL